MSMTIKEEIKLIRKIVREEFTQCALKHYPNRRKHDTRHVLDGFPIMAYNPESSERIISNIKNQGIIGWNFEDSTTYAGGSNDLLVKYEKHTENKDVHS